ncbi:hypothetical protein [Limimaricola litoreus]|uniref:RES domain-containing protein n=1 Tax=Limimaricola litoreus TaxID=2955316 RepID=A0A9X2JPM7_9RHOB|nr:hypothetical protein [Limimaricola litoreus]MCP1170157.1 hypothetical protein [Limimaricola litoreus]
MALASYLTPNDPARWIWPLHLAAPGLADLRDPSICAALGVDPRNLVSRWTEARAKGRAVCSWEVSDRMRAKGLNGFLYPSRKSPEHGHVTLFGTTRLRKAGPPRRWSPPAPDCQAKRSLSQTRHACLFPEARLRRKTVRFAGHAT